jgi:hypothetical protein
VRGAAAGDDAACLIRHTSLPPPCGYMPVSGQSPVAAVTRRWLPAARFAGLRPHLAEAKALQKSRSGRIQGSRVRCQHITRLAENLCFVSRPFEHPALGFRIRSPLYRLPADQMGIGPDVLDNLTSDC